MDRTPLEMSQLLKTLAREAGFDLVGIARAQPSAYPDAYRDWIAAGQHGEMDYLARGVEERLDITQKFPWAKTVLCVALAYYQEMPHAPHGAEQPVGKIARYAWGRDYHKVMDGNFRAIERTLREILPHPLQAKSYSDTGPILEREFAARAGLGWVGKNTLLIHPYHGSWFLLGEMVLNVDAEPDSPIGQHCGTCTRCIDACPTDAISPYKVNGARCISYLTLEHRGEISQEFHAPMADAGFVVGCDICQEVCPFNRRPLPMTAADFQVKEPAPAIDLTQILAWQEAEWDEMTRGRAFRRTKHAMWQRNADIVRP